MSSSTSTSTPAVTLSTRPAFSCTPCRSRKVRCDRRRNCGNCQRREEECIWPKSAWAIESDKPTIERIDVHDALQSRVERLESIIAKAGLDRLEKLPQGNRLSSSSSPSPPPHPTDQVAIDDLLEPSDVTHHDDFDHQIISRKRRRKVRGLDLKSSLEVEQALPSKSRCDHLVEVYFERVEWIHHVVHRPTFQVWYSRYWSNGLDRTSTSLHSLALLFSMLCLALHFDDQLSKPDLDGENRYFDASCKALQLGDYLSRHSIVVLQTLIMQGLWLNDMGLSEMHHANLGLAIRIANVMGLSRLDAPRSSGPTLSRPTRDVSSFSEKEMKRRIYWSLICQDCYTASSCNFTYLIQSSQIKLDMFINVDDDELIHLDKVFEQNDSYSIIQKIRREGLSSGPTTSSYHIAKIPFAYTAKKFVDLYNANDMSYQSILKLDRETRDCYNALPDYLMQGYQRHHSRELQWQQLFLSITLHNRIMRLHRPFLTRGYTEPEYSYSVEATLTSAKALLELIAKGQEISFPGMRWWVVLIHIFTAGVALCIDYHYHQGNKSFNSNRSSLIQDEERQQWVQIAVSHLNEVSSFSDAANRAVEILESLRNQVQSRSTLNTPQLSPPELMTEYAPNWDRLFEQALNGDNESYNTDQAILETIQTFALGAWPT